MDDPVGVGRRALAQLGRRRGHGLEGDDPPAVAGLAQAPAVLAAVGADVEHAVDAVLRQQRGDVAVGGEVRERRLRGPPVLAQAGARRPPAPPTAPGAAPGRGPAASRTTAPEPARCTSTPSAPSARRAPRRRVTAALTGGAPRGCGAGRAAAGCDRAGRSSARGAGARRGPCRSPPARASRRRCARATAAGPGGRAGSGRARTRWRTGRPPASSSVTATTSRRPTAKRIVATVAQRVAVGREARRDVHAPDVGRLALQRAGRRRGPRPRRARRRRARAARGGSCRAAAQAADLDERAGPLVGRRAVAGPSSRRSRRAPGPARRGRARPGRGRRSRGPGGGSSGARARCPPRAPGRG